MTTTGTKANNAPQKARDDSGWWEVVKIIIEAFAIAMVVRLFLLQPFNIPSGSMKPSLRVGDFLFVSKWSYGYSKYSFHFQAGLFGITLIDFRPNLFQGRIFAHEPKRGDVAVFKYPYDNTTDYIKRVIGLPGDTIEMRGGTLYINGAPVPKVPTGEFVTTEDGEGVQKIPKFTETLPNGVTYTVLDSEANGPYDNTGPYKVPAGHYFMMGDNRDNSADSRVLHKVGYVPFENLIGRAEFIFFSAKVDEGFGWLLPWTWPTGIRWDRLFTAVH